MEWFWYITASIGAGVGTGLAGLSAATIMVPILIVLCPSFSGETGVYQATAIALASDIFGSAVTTAVYIRNGKIDLKRGWIMLVCILSMCIAGSYAAYRVGNTTLGGFTLFLTFCIGIRFLLKPDTRPKDGGSTGGKLDAKGIAISLFFGLTIGFGTGFVGSGGGMMMLVVFTLFLGMELKTAVGTSTFIMTFTALIASVSHILIHPAIITQRGNVLVLCMITATLSSLFSARFANRVKNRTMGLVTGAVLTILGAAMICLNYRNWFEQTGIVRSSGAAFIKSCLYLIAAAVTALTIRFVFRSIPGFIFRKILHLAAFTSLIFTILISGHWYDASITFALFIVIIWPLLALLESCSWYGSLFVQKRSGEIKSSLILIFGMAAVLTWICWGILGHRDMLVAALAMWGSGDGAAAIAGTIFGKHHYKNSRIARKTWEGTAAMVLVSAAAGILCLLLFFGLPLSRALFLVLPSAVTGAAVELISSSEADTVTVPVSIVILMCLLISA